LGIVLGSGEEGQLIGGGEVGPNLLHLPEALPLPPLGSAVLEPDLPDKAIVTRGRPGREALSSGRSYCSLSLH
jgi:hypothetical protein